MVIGYCGNSGLHKLKVLNHRHPGAFNMLRAWCSWKGGYQESGLGEQDVQNILFSISLIY